MLDCALKAEAQHRGSNIEKRAFVALLSMHGLCEQGLGSPKLPEEPEKKSVKSYERSLEQARIKVVLT